MDEQSLQALEDAEYERAAILEDAEYALSAQLEDAEESSLHAEQDAEYERALQPLIAAQLASWEKAAQAAQAARRSSCPFTMGNAHYMGGKIGKNLFR